MESNEGSPELALEILDEPTDDDVRSDTENSSISSVSEDRSHEVVEDNDSLRIPDHEWEPDEKSSSSDDESLHEIDEWYPLERRRTQYPDFFFPSRTPNVFSLNYQAPAGRNHHVDLDEEEEILAEKDDEEYQNHLIDQAPTPSREEMTHIVLDYMISHGFREPAEALCKEMKIQVPTEDIRLMHLRNELKQLIIDGNMALALEKVEVLCPGLLQSDERLHFKFRKQHIIEMIRAGEIDEPIRYAREHLKKDMENPEILEELEMAFTLIVYDVVGDSPFHHLYNPSERMQLANQVNSAILGKLGKPKYSKLDMIAKTITWARTATVSMPVDSKNTKFWAKSSFDTPYHMDDFVQLALQKEPMDLTQEMC